MRAGETSGDWPDDVASARIDGAGHVSTPSRVLAVTVSFARVTPNVDKRRTGEPAVGRDR